MKPGQTWLFLQGVRSQKDYTTSGTSLAVKFWITRVGGLGGRMYKVGPGGMYGSYTDVNRVPSSIYATCHADDDRGGLDAADGQGTAAQQVDLVERSGAMSCAVAASWSGATPSGRQSRFIPRLR